jgi:hypothetical protein
MSSLSRPCAQDSKAPKSRRTFRSWRPSFEVAVSGSSISSVNLQGGDAGINYDFIDVLNVGVGS